MNIETLKKLARIIAKETFSPEVADINNWKEINKKLSWEINVIPQGQMAWLVQELSIAIKFDSDEPKHLEVSFNYYHGGGGSNGYSRNYRIFWKDKEPFLVNLINLYVIEQELARSST